MESKVLYTTARLTYWERAGLSREQGDVIDEVIVKLRVVGIHVTRESFCAKIFGGDNVDHQITKGTHDTNEGRDRA